MQALDLETQLLKACRRLGAKELFASPADSFSIRVPGVAEMLLATGAADWHRAGREVLSTQTFTSQGEAAALHGAIYRERPDVGAVAIAWPVGVRLLAAAGGVLPPLFDEQIRHLGKSALCGLAKEPARAGALPAALRKGANAALGDDRVLCLGITCDKAVSNLEVLEKCARAFVIAHATGATCKQIPTWVRLIANRRLLKEEARAAETHGRGEVPEKLSAY